MDPSILTKIMGIKLILYSKYEADIAGIFFLLKIIDDNIPKNL